MEMGGVLYGGSDGIGGTPAAASSVERRSADRSEPETPPGFSQRSPQLHQGAPSGFGPLPRQQQQQQGWVSSGSAAPPLPAVAQEAAKPWRSPLQRPSPTVVRETPPEHDSPGAAARARLWQAAARSITPNLRPGSVGSSATPSSAPPTPETVPAAAAALPAAVAAPPQDAAGQITPGSQQWRALVPRLLSAGGGASWRVILGEGERLGPFTPKQMADWLLQGRAPPGAGRGAGPAGGDLLVCGIKDYSAQKLPGLR
jgi:hypothetical protein